MRTLRNDPTRRMHDVVIMARASFPEADLGQLDRTALPGWIAQLREAEAEVRVLRKRLEALREDVERACPVCGEPLVGRPDKTYCGGTCRQRARRAQGGAGSSPNQAPRDTQR